VGDGLGVGDGVAVGRGVGVGVAVGAGVAVGRGVGVGVGVAVGFGAVDGTGLAVGEAVGNGLAEGAAVGVADGAGSVEGIGVGVGAGVGSAVGSGGAAVGSAGGVVAGSAGGAGVGSASLSFAPRTMKASTSTDGRPVVPRTSTVTRCVPTVGYVIVNSVSRYRGVPARRSTVLTNSPSTHTVALPRSGPLVPTQETPVPANANVKLAPIWLDRMMPEPRYRASRADSHLPAVAAEGVVSWKTFVSYAPPQVEARRSAG
jgi:hypothetical protein